MSVAYFERSALVPKPWKNGGGVTREIVSYPPGAGIEDFEWRVSIATIAADGPFSVFNGIDRVITLLRGAGMRLRSLDFDRWLDQPLEPFAFRGEAPVECTLLSGESQDFNVMTRREQLRADVRVVSGAQRTDSALHGLLFATRGTWDVQLSGSASETRRTLHADTGLWWSDELLSCRLSPSSADAALIAVRLVR